MSLPSHYVYVYVYVYVYRNIIPLWYNTVILIGKNSFELCTDTKQLARAHENTKLRITHYTLVYGQSIILEFKYTYK